MQNNIQNRNFYNEILTEHNMRPEFKYDLPAANVVLEGVNPNCGDDIWLKLKVENGVIEDGSFVGDGCAISQASADIMLGMIIGKTKEEALELGQLFLKMIQGEATDEEIEQFRDVLLTLLPTDIAPWARSIQLRGITLPMAVREELLMIVAEERAKKSHADGNTSTYLS